MLISISLLLFVHTACGEEEENDFIQNGTEADDLGTEIRDTIIYESVVDRLMRVDTLETGEIKHSSHIGHALYPERPDRYYIGVEKQEDAVSFFREEMVPLEARDSIRTLADGSLVLHTIGGDMTFHLSNDDTDLAIVDVDFQKQPYIKQFIFIRNSEWPYNDQSSPFTYGQIWRCDNGWYYFCAKAWDAYGPGKLMTTDGGWREDWFRKYMGCYRGPFCVYTDCASEQAWKGLHFYVYNRNDIFKKKIKILMDKLGASVYKSRTLAILSEMANGYMDNYTFNLGNMEYKEHRRSVFDKWHYHVRVNYCSLKNEKFTSWSTWYECRKTSFFYYTVDTPRNEIPSSEVEFDNKYEKINESGVTKIRINGHKYELVAQ